MPTTINQIASSALKGQSVIVYLNGAEAISKLPAIVIGQKAIISSSSKVGYVCSVDYEGTTYKVTPVTPDARFDSTTTPGILAAAETITLT